MPQDAPEVPVAWALWRELEREPAARDFLISSDATAGHPAFGAVVCRNARGSGMAFFEPPPPSSEPEPEPLRLPWMRPEDVLGAVVPVNFVLARTDDVAVAVWGITVFRDGFEFTVASLTKRRLPHRLRMHHFELMHEVRAGGDVPAEFLRFGISCADGGTVTNLRPGFSWGSHTDDGDHTSPAAGDRVLMPGGGGGSDRHWTQKYWCWPLPPPGPVTFVCEWPALGIGETSHQIDSQSIREAAGRSKPIWP